MPADTIHQLYYTANTGQQRTITYTCAVDKQKAVAILARHVAALEFPDQEKFLIAGQRKMPAEIEKRLEEIKTAIIAENQERELVADAR